MHLLSNAQPAGERIKRISSVYHERLSVFLSPLLGLLDERLDRRLVHTFSLLVEAIIRFRHRQHGLLLSELGAYLLSPDKAPAGTKRISNLLRSGKWHYSLLADWLRSAAPKPGAWCVSVQAFSTRPCNARCMCRAFTGWAFCSWACTPNPASTCNSGGAPAWARAVSRQPRSGAGV